MESWSSLSLKREVRPSLKSDTPFPLGLGEIIHHEFHNSKEMNSAHQVSLGEDPKPQVGVQH